MSLEALKSEIDALVSGKWPAIVQAASSRKDAKGCFRKFPELCTITPADGSLAIQDKALLWTGSGILEQLGALLKCSFRCEEYQSLQGNGFALTATFIWQGDTYFKRWQEGPDRSQAMDWKKVVSLIGGGK